MERRKPCVCWPGLNHYCDVGTTVITQIAAKELFSLMNYFQKAVFYVFVCFRTWPSYCSVFVCFRTWPSYCSFSEKIQIFIFFFFCQKKTTLETCAFNVVLELNWATSTSSHVWPVKLLTLNSQETEMKCLYSCSICVAYFMQGYSVNNIILPLPRSIADHKLP